MWQIKNPEVKPSKLDFGSSGQDKRLVSQLFADGIKLINALELVEWDEHSQFLICEACGFPGCKSRDWVSVRRSDSLVLFLPSSEYVWREEKDYMEYCPPAYLKQRGIPYLDSATYESLRSRHSLFPAIEQLQLLKVKEATMLFQWTAPDRILGEPPEVNLRHDLFVGSSEGDHAEHIKTLEDLVKKQYESEDSAVLRSISANERVISFYLDAAAFTEWQAMVFDGSEYRLLVDSKYVVDPILPDRTNGSHVVSRANSVFALAVLWFYAGTESDGKGWPNLASVDLVDWVMHFKYGSHRFGFVTFGLDQPSGSGGRSRIGSVNLLEWRPQQRVE